MIASRRFRRPNFTEGLNAISVPTLILHGYNDQIVPIDAGKLSVKLVPNTKLKIYPGAPRGMCSDQKGLGQRRFARIHQELTLGLSPPLFFGRISSP